MDVEQSRAGWTSAGCGLVLAGHQELANFCPTPPDEPLPVLSGLSLASSSAQTLHCFTPFARTFPLVWRRAAGRPFAKLTHSVGDAGAPLGPLF